MPNNPIKLCSFVNLKITRLSYILYLFWPNQSQFVFSIFVLKVCYKKCEPHLGRKGDFQCCVLTNICNPYFWTRDPPAQSLGLGAEACWQPRTCRTSLLPISHRRMVCQPLNLVWPASQPSASKTRILCIFAVLFCNLRQ